MYIIFKIMRQLEGILHNKLEILNWLIRSLLERGKNLKTNFLKVLMIGMLLVGVGAGSFALAGPSQQRKGIIIYHNDWGGAIPAMQTELKNRGYSVTVTDNANLGLQAITQTTTALKTGDYLVVYLAGHGSNPRNFGDTTKAVALEHFVQFNNGILAVKQTAPLFEQIAAKGVNLTVIDGSCNGGETVYYAMGQKYCAMATAGMYSPGLTGFPYPSEAINKDTNPGKVGSWWGYPHMIASWMNGAIICGVPMRIHQRLYRNDNTDIANLSLFERSSIGILTSLDMGGWNLHYQYCYLYKYIYPDDYAALDTAEKSKFTNSTQTYLATMHAIIDPGAQFHTKLNGFLNDANLLDQAAKVYAAQYTQVWQTLANDPSWNITAEPVKYASQMKDVTPDAYKAEAGFQKIAGEIEFLMSILQNGYQQQDALLTQIDTVARDVYSTHYKLPDLTKKVLVAAWPPKPGDPLLKYNQHEKTMLEKIAGIEKLQKINRSLILGLENQRLETKPLRLSPQVRMENAKKVLDRGVEVYQSNYNLSLGDKYPGLSQAGLDAAKLKNLEQLIGKFKAISPTIYYAEGRLSFLLSIFEDAVNKVQSGGNTVPAQVQF